MPVLSVGLRKAPVMLNIRQYCVLVSNVGIHIYRDVVYLSERWDGEIVYLRK